MNRGTKTFVAVVLFGALWGVLEAVLGGALAYFPFRGAIMSNIALFLVALGISSSRNYHTGIYMGLIASTLKLTDTFILGVPVLSQTIIAPASAILIESLLFPLVLYRMRFLEHKRLFVAGPVANFMAFVVISLLFVHRGFVGTAGAMLLKSVVSIAGSAFICPLADLLGSKLEKQVSTISL